MKNVWLALIGATVLLCCSCSKDDDEQLTADAGQMETVDAQGHMVFYSTAGRGSKVGMSSRTTQGFHATDLVTMLEAGGEASVYKVDAANSTLCSGSSTLYSRAKLVYKSGSELTEGENHYAVMPSATWSGENIAVVQKATQTASAGTHDATGCIHYGTTQTNSIALDNLSTMFRLVVVGENTSGVDEVRLAGEGVAGNATITTSTGAISKGDANTVIFKTSDGEYFEHNTVYYFAFLPGTYATLTITPYIDGTAQDRSFVTYNGKTWRSGTVYNLYLKDGELYSKCPSVDDGGILPGEFSASASTIVRFSSGNLQYITTGTHDNIDENSVPGIWRFAEHQWDFIGADNMNASSTYDGWIDLFAWGTSGWSGGVAEYQPYIFSSNASDNYIKGVYTNDFSAYPKADWGVYNAISNGSNIAEFWRTPTMDEWTYLFNGRPGHDDKYGMATVNGVQGVVLLPDSWYQPDGLSFTAGTSSGFNTNIYAIDEWVRMEVAGAVFLPAAGQRSPDFWGGEGDYWSSSVYAEASEEIYAKQLYFEAGGVHYDYGCIRYCGLAVRLVHE